MMRIIPRLEIKGANLVKGIRFDGLRVLGDPRDFAMRYYQDGADELFYLDIVASLYERKIMPEVVRRTSEIVFIPLTVGGGVRSLDDISVLLESGADKVAINTGAIRRPALIDEAAREFGSQCIVLSIEAKKVGNRYEPFCEAGRQPTGRDVEAWAREGVDRGAGEIFITSGDQEGVGKGFEIELARSFKDISVPIVLGGGCGNAGHVGQLLSECYVDGIACSSLFHYRYLKEILENSPESQSRVDFIAHKEVNYGMKVLDEDSQPCSVAELKEYLVQRGVEVRRVI